jgi:hypothetical protein
MARKLDFPFVDIFFSYAGVLIKLGLSAVIGDELATTFSLVAQPP